MASLPLTNEADPNSLMLEDITPLYLAATGGWIDGLNLLLDWGASINAQDAHLRETPLHKTARNLEMTSIKRLCARVADMEPRDIDGLTYESFGMCAAKP